MKTKYIIAVILISIILSSCKQSGQNVAINTEAINKAYEKIANDSIKEFYNDLFRVTKTDYLHRNEINLDSIIIMTKQALTKAKTFDDALKELPNFFDAINCGHCSLIYKDQDIYPTIDEPSDSLFSKALADRFKKFVDFEAKVLANKYGYISVPPIILNSFDKKKLDEVSREFYDKIYEIKSKNNIKGWIIDLRLNQGGTPYPMMLCLYDFLGDNMVFQYLNEQKKTISQIRFEDGKLYDRPGVVTSIKPKGKMLTNAKVAVLISPATASAGETVAMCFKGRKNTIFIGEKTTGLTTTNAEIITPYNGNLALTMGYMADRNWKTYDVITPDIEVLKQDNFNDLLQDKKVQKAIAYLNE